MSTPTNTPTATTRPVNTPINIPTATTVPLCSKVTEIPQTECEALVTLYRSTNGTNWTTKTGWNTTNIPCSWNGVTCSGVHVTQIALPSNNLSGSIPPQLGNLTALQQLDLGYNQLSGSIPPELGKLTNLQNLYLGYNQLSGSIPNTLGNLTNLIDLDLASNQLSESIPPELGNLTNLQNLYLYSNQLSGSIPPELGNLANLQDLFLGSNQLSGSIPPELGNLTNLQDLFLGFSQLSGSIPTTLSSLTNLTYLNLYSNQLIGDIPPELGNLANLQKLFLGKNQLSGSVPSTLGNLANLEALWLDSNQLSGILPLTLPKLTHLEAFHFDSNPSLCEPTDAVFQSWLTKIPDWKGTGISCNPLTTTPISKPITTPTNTATATATAIPADCSKVSEIPRAECEALVAFYKSTNGPKWITKLGWNTMKTPCSWYGVGCSAGHVTELYLSWNQLSGSIPPELGNLANVQTLHLSNNQLNGVLPSTLSNLTKLMQFYFSGNPNLCVPKDTVFQKWLTEIPNRDGDGISCTALTATAASRPTNTSTSTKTATSKPTNTPTLTAFATSTPTNILTNTTTVTDTSTPTNTPTITSSPTYTPTMTATSTPVTKVFQCGLLPSNDGYSFENKSYVLPGIDWEDLAQNESWKLIRLAFVGSHDEDFFLEDKTTLRPGIKLFSDMLIDTGSSGVCQGFAASSLARSKRYPETQEGSLLNPEHKNLATNLLPSKEDVWNYLFLYQIRQFGRGYLAWRITEGYNPSPLDSYKLLRDSLTDCSREQHLAWIVDLGTGDAHALVPYRIEELGEIGKIFVYDSNHPNDATKFIKVDLTKKAWEYDLGIDEQRNTIKWLGAESGSFLAPPLSAVVSSELPAAELLGGKCSRCGRPRMSLSSVGKDVNVSIADEQGRILGYQNGQIGSEIPGGLFVPSLGFNLKVDNPKVLKSYAFPEGNYQAKVQSTSNEPYDITIFGTGNPLKLTGLLNTNSIDISSDLAKVQVQSSSNVPYNITAFGEKNTLKLNGLYLNNNVNISSDLTKVQVQPIDSSFILQHCFVHTTESVDSTSIRTVELCVKGPAGGLASFEVFTPTSKIHYNYNNYSGETSYTFKVEQVGRYPFRYTNTGTFTSTLDEEVVVLNYGKRVGFSLIGLYPATCQNTVTDLTVKGLVGSSVFSATIPASATIQIAGSGFRLTPPTSVNLTFENGQKIEAKPTRLLDKAPLISPPGEMGYLFQMQGPKGLVTGQINEADPAKQTGEALVIYAPKSGAEKWWSSTYTTTLQYAWGGDNGRYSIGPATLVLTLPATLVNTTTVKVKVAVMDKNVQTPTDRRIAIVKAEAGRITATQTLIESDSPNVNLVEMTLENVPSGTQNMTVTLDSPRNIGSQMNTDGAGDSVFLLGAVAQRECCTLNYGSAKAYDSEKILIISNQGTTWTNDQVQFDFPAGLVTDTIGSELKYEAAYKPQHPLKKGQNAVRSFLLKATDTEGTQVLKTQKEYTIMLSYNCTDLAMLGITDESTLTLAFWDEAKGEWVPVTSKVDQVNQKVTASLDYFTEFALIGNTATTSTKQQVFLPLIQK